MIVYPINRIRMSTHVGGHMHGASVVEIRMQGCDVLCRDCSAPEALMCDQGTHQESLEDANARKGDWTTLNAGEITDAIRELLGDVSTHSVRWVKITGGEPMMYALHELSEAIRANGWRLMIETSGSYCRSGVACDWLIVSALLGQDRATVPHMIRIADEIRAVIKTNKELMLFNEVLTECSQNKGGSAWRVWHDRVVLVPARGTKAETRAARALCDAEARWHGWRVI